MVAFSCNCGPPATSKQRLEVGPRRTISSSAKAAYDPEGDGAVSFELTSLEERLIHLDLGRLEIFETATFIECPLLKSR